MDSLPVARSCVDVRRRWIRIATVWQGYGMAECVGMAGIWKVILRGRSVWCASAEHRTFDGVMNTVETRLDMAGLRQVAVVSAWPCRPTGIHYAVAHEARIWVLVERNRRGTWRRKWRMDKAKLSTDDADDRNG